MFKSVDVKFNLSKLLPVILLCNLEDFLRFLFVSQLTMWEEVFEDEEDGEDVFDYYGDVKEKIQKEEDLISFTIQVKPYLDRIKDSEFREFIRKKILLLEFYQKHKYEQSSDIAMVLTFLDSNGITDKVLRKAYEQNWNGSIYDITSYIFFEQYLLKKKDLNNIKEFSDTLCSIDNVKLETRRSMLLVARDFADLMTQHIEVVSSLFEKCVKENKRKYIFMFENLCKEGLTQSHAYKIATGLYWMCQTGCLRKYKTDVSKDDEKFLNKFMEMKNAGAKFTIDYPILDI